jgi:hypothetical protein
MPDSERRTADQASEISSKFHHDLLCPVLRVDPSGKSLKTCQACSKKIFLLPRRGKSVAYLRPSHPTQGAARDRHETRGGMRWTWMLRLTSAADADGEVAWTWRPDAGVKLRGVICGVTVATKPVTGVSAK